MKNDLMFVFLGPELVQSPLDSDWDDSEESTSWRMHSRIERDIQLSEMEEKPGELSRDEYGDLWPSEEWSEQDTVFIAQRYYAIHVVGRPYATYLEDEEGDGEEVKSCVSTACRWLEEAWKLKAKVMEDEDDDRVDFESLIPHEKYHGVYWNKGEQCWQSLAVDGEGRIRDLGLYANDVHAAQNRDFYLVKNGLVGTQNAGQEESPKDKVAMTIRQQSSGDKRLGV